MISLIKGNSLERETDLGGHPLRCGAADNAEFHVKEI